jgi:hypothetical protein
LAFWSGAACVFFFFFFRAAPFLEEEEEELEKEPEEKEPDDILLKLAKSRFEKLGRGSIFAGWSSGTGPSKVRCLPRALSSKPAPIKTGTLSP